MMARSVGSRSWRKPGGRAHFGSDAFFFSVHTISTIGYGGMSPDSTYGEVLVVFESFIGLVGVALITGLMLPIPVELCRHYSSIAKDQGSWATSPTPAWVRYFCTPST